jgi:GT2 family glycosyltransferase
MPPRVSALIVNYRSYEHASRCLASVERADPEVVCILVDHESDPASLDRLQRAHPAARCVARAGNPGFGAGINCAAALAAGRYLLVLNPDTAIAPGAIETLAGWLDQHGRVAVVSPMVRSGSGVIEASARAFPDWTTVLAGRSSWLSRRWPSNRLSRRNLLTGHHVDMPIDADWVTGACMLLRREAFDSVGGFDEAFFLYWEDADLCQRLRSAGWTITYHPGARVVHLGGQSSRHRAPASAVAFHRSAYRYFSKHGGRARHVLAPLVFLGLHVRLGFALAHAQRERARLSPMRPKA